MLLLHVVHDDRIRVVSLDEADMILLFGVFSIYRQFCYLLVRSEVHDDAPFPHGYFKSFPQEQDEQDEAATQTSAPSLTRRHVQDF